MKFFIAFVAIVAVASAGVVKPTTSDAAQVEAIIAAINHPSTDPATAVLLEQQLMEILGVANPTPVIVDKPVTIDDSPTPISVGPALIDFPLPDGGAVTAVDPTPVPAPAPSPVIIGEIPEASSAPLVQIILNINAAPGTVVNPSPVIVPEVPAVRPPASPVSVVDVAQNTPEIVPTPVHVVEVAADNLHPITSLPALVPIIVEPVLVGTPVFPGVPAVNLPGAQLN